MYRHEAGESLLVWTLTSISFGYNLDKITNSCYKDYNVL